MIGLFRPSERAASHQKLLFILFMPVRTLQLDGGWTKIAAPTDENESGTKADYRTATYDNYYTALLDKSISLFASAMSTTPIGSLTLCQFLNDCYSGKYKEQVNAIRTEPDKALQSELKKALPAVTIQSEICEHRNNDACVNNSIICLDFDDVDDIEDAKQKIFAVPYVLAVCTSASGRGLFAIAVLAQPADDLKLVLTNMQTDFVYSIDKSCSNMSRLRFVTYDPDLLLKERVVPYDETLYPIEPQAINQPAVSSVRSVNAVEIDYRVLPYINAMPEAIQGCNGSVAALNVCNKLFEFGLDRETAKQIFKTYYNPRCKPLWSDDEIDHKLDTAYQKPLKLAGSMLDKSQALRYDERHNVSKPSSNSKIKLTRFDDIEDRPVEWFMHNRIPANDLTVLSGDGSGGKTYFTCHLAAHTTTGNRWADGTSCKKGNVVFFPPEGQKAALKRRLVANGADLKKCWLLDGKISSDPNTGTEWVDLINLEDSTWIADAIDEIEMQTGEPVVLVIIDPVGNYAGQGDSYKDTDVRRMLTPLQRLADEKQVTFLLVAHHNKGEQSSAHKKVMGSAAWVNLARAHWVVSVDNADKDLRYFAPSKTNDCINPKAIAYHLASQEGQWEAQVQIISMEVDKTANDLMQEQAPHHLLKKRFIGFDSTGHTRCLRHRNRETCFYIGEMVIGKRSKKLFRWQNRFDKEVLIIVDIQTLKYVSDERNAILPALKMGDLD